MKKRIFVILSILVLFLLDPFQSLITNSKTVSDKSEAVTAQVEFNTPEQPDNPSLLEAQDWYSVRRKSPAERIQAWDPRVVPQKFIVVSDFASFPGFLPSTHDQSEVRHNINNTVIHLDYKRGYRFGNRDLWESGFMKQDVSLFGTFGRFDEQLIKRALLPSKICIVGAVYHLGKTEIANHGLETFFKRRRLIVMIPQAADILSGNPNSFGEDTLKMHWRILGGLVTEKNKPSAAKFSFDSAINYKAEFYASNFQVQSTSELITIDHSINSGKDITITIKEAIAIPPLMAKIFGLLAIITLVLCFQVLKWWLAQLSNYRRSPHI